jgi:hypothetical protein
LPRRVTLNPRQRWFVDALKSGLDVRAADLRHRWGTSEKTARRDLAALKALRMISFGGSRRWGRYQPEGCVRRHDKLALWRHEELARLVS